MSIFMTNDEINRIIEEICKTIEDYSKVSADDYTDKVGISDNMVYRERK